MVTGWTNTSDAKAMWEKRKERDRDMKGIKEVGKKLLFPLPVTDHVL
jgi:hypothetical protein